MLRIKGPSCVNFMQIINSEADPMKLRTDNLIFVNCAVCLMFRGPKNGKALQQIVKTQPNLRVGQTIAMMMIAMIPKTVVTKLTMMFILIHSQTLHWGRGSLWYDNISYKK